MSSYNEYMRQYRLKHRDRINAQQRERRKGQSVKVKGEDQNGSHIEMVVETKSSRHLCMRPLCDSYETDRYPINGRDMYLCIKHQPK